MEGFQDHQLPLTFIDFKKVFDSINRKVIFVVLRHYGIPEPLVHVIGALYNNSKSAVVLAVMVDGNISDLFEVSTGVLQGDVLAPFLFIILVDYLLKKATSDLDDTTSDLDDTTSSTDTSNTLDQESGKRKPVNRNKLKLIVINFQSMSNKKAELEAIIA